MYLGQRKRKEDKKWETLQSMVNVSSFHPHHSSHQSFCNCNFVNTQGSAQQPWRLPISPAIHRKRGMTTAAVPSLAVNGVKTYLPVRETKLLLSELRRQFSNLGRVSGGTGGSVSIKLQDESQQFVFMSPSGIQKEMMVPDDMYALSSQGTAISSPKPKWSDCGPFFMQAECYHYLFEAAIKLHQIGLNWSSPLHSPLVTVKGASSTSQYVAKSAKGGGDMEPTRRCVVLDIEGTTTPISFVTDVLFPYARDNVGRHLSATYDTPETQDDIKLLRAQIEDDLEKGVAGAVPVPPASEGKEEVVAALVANVEAMIKADRKITALKQLQGHIWRTGFQNNELEGVVYEDVPDALDRWHTSGVKVYIYSSGSRLAQRLIFGNTNFGDLRKYLSGFFDTKVGNKRERHSYVEIAESVGVDSPSEIVFVTDVYQEATAAKAAGLDVVLSIRPGNGPLPENHGFKTVTSFSQI